MTVVTEDRVQTTLAVGALTLNAGTGGVFVHGKRVSLSKSEFRVLLLLAQQAGTIVAKEAIMAHLYAGRTVQPRRPKIVDVILCNIRRKLRESSPEEFIDTIWGRGYRLRLQA